MDSNRTRSCISKKENRTAEKRRSYKCISPHVERGKKCLPAVALGAFLDCQLATGNGGWQCRRRRRTGRRSRGCGSFYGCFEAWLHMQLHFTAATKLITNRNARKKRRKTSLPLSLSSLEKPNAKCSWNDEMQGRHSTNFEHQVSLWFFFSFLVFFFFTFFLIIFFLFVF